MTRASAAAEHEGLLACQRDSSLRELDTEVLAVEAADGGWRVRLADTPLYPEGGGQPDDHGTIGEARVSAVRRGADGTWHSVDRRLELGSVRVRVDWARRWDHMQQHTGQHLLTAVTEATLGLKTLAFHLGATESTIDLDGHPSARELEALEEAVSRHILEDREVGWREVERGDLEGLGVRTRGLPEHIAGPVRLIEIDGLDLNTCGGTHVSRLGELQLLGILGCDRYKSGGRLRFVVGGRVLRRLRDMAAREAELTGHLRQAPEHHVSEVLRLQDAARQGVKARRLLLERLATLEGAALAARSEQHLGHHLEEVDLGVLRSVASRARRGRAGRVVLLTSGAPGAAGVFLLAGPAEVVEDLGPQVASALGGRGGGRGEIFQGQASVLSDPVALLEELLSSG